MSEDGRGKEKCCKMHFQYAGNKVDNKCFDLNTVTYDSKMNWCCRDW